MPYQNYFLITIFFFNYLNIWINSNLNIWFFILLRDWTQNTIRPKRERETARKREKINNIKHLKILIICDFAIQYSFNTFNLIWFFFWIANIYWIIVFLFFYLFFGFKIFEKRKNVYVWKCSKALKCIVHI